MTLREVTIATTLSAFAAGAGLGASLIIAIGAQNAFVLRNGIARTHVAAIVITCVACDWALIALGAVGFGSLVEAFPMVTDIATWGGALFLFGFGALSFRAALRPGALDERGAASRAPLVGTGAAVAATLAVSLLNPHVYLDTVVLLGGLAGRYAMPLRWWFVLGAGLSSLAWFSAIGFGGRLLAPAFARPGTWRALDLGIGIVMWWIAASLVL